VAHQPFFPVILRVYFSFILLSPYHKPWQLAKDLKMNSSNERNDVLCSLCSTLTASISDGAWEVIHSTYQDIQLQAQQGCTFCTALCLAIEPPGPNGHKSVHQIYENNVVHLRISPDHISTIMPYLENTQNYPYIGRILKNRVLKLRFNDCMSSAAQN